MHITSLCEKHTHRHAVKLACKMYEQFATCPGTLLRSDLLLNSFLVSLTYFVFSVFFFPVSLHASSPSYFRGFTLIALKEGREGVTPDDYAGNFKVRDCSDPV